MRTTYTKVTNTIIVELSLDEVKEYLATEFSTRSDNLKQVENHYELTIPCGIAFYDKTQRRKGGVQGWNPDELRQAIRAAVANRLVPWESACIEPEKFRVFKQQWMNIYQQLLRNVRLKFPSHKHPRERLGRRDWEHKKEWRARFVVG